MLKHVFHSFVEYKKMRILHNFSPPTHRNRTMYEFNLIFVLNDNEPKSVEILNVGRRLTSENRENTENRNSRKKKKEQMDRHIHLHLVNYCFAL